MALLDEYAKMIGIEEEKKPTTILSDKPVIYDADTPKVGSQRYRLQGVDAPEMPTKEEKYRRLKEAKKSKTGRYVSLANAGERAKLEAQLGTLDPETSITKGLGDTAISFSDDESTPQVIDYGTQNLEGSGEFGYYGRPIIDNPEYVNKLIGSGYGVPAFEKTKGSVELASEAKRNKLGLWGTAYDKDMQDVTEKRNGLDKVYTAKDLFQPRLESDARNAAASFIQYGSGALDAAHDFFTNMYGKENIDNEFEKWFFKNDFLNEMKEAKTAKDITGASQVHLDRAEKQLDEDLSNEDYFKAFTTVGSNFDIYLAESAGEMGLLAAKVPGLVAAVANRTNNQIEAYRKNNNGLDPDKQRIAEMIVGNTTALGAEQLLLLKPIAKIFSAMNKGGIGSKALGVLGSTLGETAQETFDQLQEAYTTKEGTAKYKDKDYITKEELIKAGISGAGVGGATRASAEALASVPGVKRAVSKKIGEKVEERRAGGSNISKIVRGTFEVARENIKNLKTQRDINKANQALRKQNAKNVVKEPTVEARATTFKDSTDKLIELNNATSDESKSRIVTQSFIEVADDKGMDSNSVLDLFNEIKKNPELSKNLDIKKIQSHGMRTVIDDIMKTGTTTNQTDTYKPKSNFNKIVDTKLNKFKQSVFGSMSLDEESKVEFDKYTQLVKDQLDKYAKSGGKKTFKDVSQEILDLGFIESSLIPSKASVKEHRNRILDDISANIDNSMALRTFDTFVGSRLNKVHKSFDKTKRGSDILATSMTDENNEMLSLISEAKKEAKSIRIEDTRNKYINKLDSLEKDLIEANKVLAPFYTKAKPKTKPTPEAKYDPGYKEEKSVKKEYKPEDSPIYKAKEAESKVSEEVTEEIATKPTAEVAISEVSDEVSVDLDYEASEEVTSKRAYIKELEKELEDNTATLEDDKQEIINLKDELDGLTDKKRAKEIKKELTRLRANVESVTTLRDEIKEARSELKDLTKTLSTQITKDTLGARVYESMNTEQKKIFDVVEPRDEKKIFDAPGLIFKTPKEGVENFWLNTPTWMKDKVQNNTEFANRVLIAMRTYANIIGAVRGKEKFQIKIPNQAIAFTGETNQVDNSIKDLNIKVTENGSIDYGVKDSKVNPIAMFGTIKDGMVNLSDEVQEIIKFEAVNTYGDILRSMNLRGKERDRFLKEGFFARDEEEINAANELIMKGTVPRHIFQRAAGRNILNNLGLKVKDNIDINSLEELELSLGMIAIASLKTNGLLGKQVFSKGKLVGFPKAIKLTEASDNIPVIHVNINNKVQNKLIREASSIMQYVDPNRANKNVSLEPIKTGLVKNVRGSKLDMSKQSIDYINDMQSRPWKFNDTFKSIVTSGININDLYSMFGVVSDAEIAKMSLSDAEVALVNNEANKQDIDYMLQTYMMTGENEFYLPWDMTVSGRYMIDSNTFNPQDSKISRFMAQNNDMKSSVKYDSKTKTYDKKNMHLFRVAMAQALDFEPDKMTDEKAISDMAKEAVSIDDNGNLKFNKDTELGSALRRAVIGINQNKYDAVIKDLVSVNRKGEGVHAVQVAFALAQFAKNKGKNIEHDLVLEADAITSGMILTLMQVASPDAVKLLVKGGIYTEERAKDVVKLLKDKDIDVKDVDLNHGLLKQENIIRDFYETVGNVVNKNAKEEEDFALEDQDFTNKDYYKSARNAALFGVTKQAFGSIGRKIAKSPVMVYIYGSSINSIKRKLSYTIGKDGLEKVLNKKEFANLDFNQIKNMYFKMLNDSKKMTYNQVVSKYKNKDFVDMVFTLGSVMPKSPEFKEFSNGQIVNSKNQVLRNLVITDEMVNKLKKTTDSAFGNGFELGFNLYFKDIDRYRSTIKQTELGMFSIFKFKYKEAINKAKESNNGVITTKIVDDVVNELIKNDLFHDVDDINGAKQDLYKVERKSALKRVVVSDLLGQGSLSGQITEKEQVVNMGAAPTTSIHSIDGFIEKESNMRAQVLNIYDANVMNADWNTVKKVTDEYNSQTINASMKQGVLNKNIKKFNRMFDKLSKEDKANLFKDEDTEQLENDFNISQGFDEINASYVLSKDELNAEILKIQQNRVKFSEEKNLTVGHSYVNDGMSLKVNIDEENKPKIDDIENADKLIEVLDLLDDKIRGIDRSENNLDSDFETTLTKLKKFSDVFLDKDYKPKEPETEDNQGYDGEYNDDENTEKVSIKPVKDAYKKLNLLGHGANKKYYIKRSIDKIVEFKNDPRKVTKKDIDNFNIARDIVNHNIDNNKELSEYIEDIVDGRLEDGLILGSQISDMNIIDETRDELVLDLENVSVYENLDRFLSKLVNEDFANGTDADVAYVEHIYDMNDKILDLIEARNQDKTITYKEYLSPEVTMGQADIETDTITVRYNPSSRLNKGSEIIMHELQHLMVEKALENNESLRRNIRAIQKTAQKYLDYNVFLSRIDSPTSDEVEQAKDMYDYSVLGTQSEFLAYAMTNQQLWTALNGREIEDTLINRIDSEKGLSGVANKLIDIVNKIYSIISHGKDSAKTIQQIVLNLMNQQMDMSSNRDEDYKGFFQEKFDKLDKNTKKISDKIEEKIDELKDVEFTTAKKVKDFIGKVTNIQGLIRVKKGRLLQDTWHTITVDTSDSKYTDFFKLFRIIKNDNDKEVAFLRDSVESTISKLVDTNTVSERSAIKRVLLDTDYRTITNDLNEYKELAQDETKLRARIYTVRSKLKKELSDSAQLLGKFLVDKVMYGSNINQNATLIYNKSRYGIANPNNKETIDLIDELASLYGLLYSGQENKDLLVQAIDKNADGIQTTMNIYYEKMKEYQDKIFGENRNYVVKGHSIEDFTRDTKTMIVKESDIEYAKKLGYKLASENKELSSLFRRERYFTMVGNNFDPAFTQGMINTIQWTTDGSSLRKLLMNQGLDIDTVNLQIEDLKNQRTIYSYDSNNEIIFDENKPNMTPEYDLEGNVVDYKIHASSKVKYGHMTHNNDIATTLAKTISNGNAKLTGMFNNIKAIDYIVDFANKNAPSNQEDFVLLRASTKEEIESNNPYEYASMWGSIPPYTRKYIFNKTGNNSLVIPKVMINNVVGYKDPSLSNITFNDKQVLANNPFIAESIRKVEGYWNEIVSKFKRIVVTMKSEVIIGNLTSNMLVAMQHGVNPVKYTKLFKKSWEDLNRHQENHEELEMLKLLRSGGRKGLDGKIKFLEREIANNPADTLIKDGLHSPIVEDISSNVFNKSTHLENLLERLFKADKLPDSVKDIVNNMYLDKRTSLYGKLLKLTQYGDIVNRMIIHQNNLDTGSMTEEQSLNYVDQLFVNYSYLDNKYLKWANDKGLFIFSKYFFRTLKAMLRMSRKNPTMSAFFQTGQGLTGIDLEDPFDKYYSPISSTLNSVGSPTDMIYNVITPNLDEIIPF